MKKTLIIILSFLFALLPLFGCAAQPASVSISEIKAWQTSSNYEKSVYEINMYEMIADKKNTVRGDIIAKGTLTFELDGNIDKISDLACTKLSMNFSVTYIDGDKAGLSRGLTDTITSEVIFQTMSFSPITSTKVATFPARKDEKQNNSYSINLNYSERKSIMNIHGQEKKLEFKAGSYFDNEQIYYLVRTLSTLKEKAALSVPMVNIFDAHNSNKFFSYNMKVTVSEKPISKTLGKWASNFGLEADGENYKLDCLQVSLGINSKSSGPPTTLYYANVPFKISETASTNKVLVEFETKEYNYASATEKYNTVYTLTDYTTVKA